MDDAPQITFCLRKAYAEKELAATVEATFGKYSLPYFSRVDILRAILIEEQRKAYYELANDSQRMLDATIEYYKNKIEDVVRRSTEEKQELINEFETGCFNTTTEMKGESNA